MKLYLAQNVLEAARARIRWLFQEFPTVHVNISGGKDSTVVLNLALEVAAELGRLPLPVTFIDQEAEWQMVIDHLRTVFADPRIAPHWYQMPIKIFNATSTREPWLQCWAEGAAWMRPKEPGAITVNRYGTDRFARLFGAILAHDYPDTPACRIAGVRCEESPSRALGLTVYETYGGVTWGTVESKARQHFTFYPIYDWSYTDVWKAIHDHGWPYCRLYDLMYQYGTPVRQMRVSNVHHETAVRTLFFLQEFEPMTWDKVTARLAGIHTAGTLGWAWYGPKQLPWMFRDWREYRDHLLVTLIADPVQQARYAQQFAATERLYHEAVLPDLLRTQISMLLVNDTEGTKLTNFTAAHMGALRGRGRLSGRTA